jgi:predicted Zn-dependent protease
VIELAGFRIAIQIKVQRGQETEADLTGLQLLQWANIDPSGMITFFERLSEKDQGRMEWLSTHPMSTARAERFKEELAALPKKLPEPFTFDWKQVQEGL